MTIATQNSPRSFYYELAGIEVNMQITQSNWTRIKNLILQKNRLIDRNLLPLLSIHPDYYCPTYRTEFCISASSKSYFYDLLLLNSSKVPKVRYLKDFPVYRLPFDPMDWPYGTVFHIHLKCIYHTYTNTWYAHGSWPAFG